MYMSVFKTSSYLLDKFRIVYQGLAIVETRTYTPNLKQIRLVAVFTTVNRLYCDKLFVAYSDIQHLCKVNCHFAYSEKQ